MQAPPLPKKSKGVHEEVSMCQRNQTDKDEEQA